MYELLENPLSQLANCAIEDHNHDHWIHVFRELVATRLHELCGLRVNQYDRGPTSTSILSSMNNGV